MDKDIIRAITVGLILFNTLIWSIFGLVYINKKVNSLDFCQQVERNKNG